MECIQCRGHLVYTTYIRVMRRNVVRHRSAQQYLAAGRFCLDCKLMEVTLDSEIERTVRLRRERAEGRGS